MENMGNRVTVIIREFFQDMEKKDPFETQLMDFRLKFRAKLLEIVTSFPAESGMAARSLNYTLESIETSLKEEMNRVNLDSEETLDRTIQTLKTMNEVLKEFMQENRIHDKRKLSQLTGYIGRLVESLRQEYKRRFGGFLSNVKKIFRTGQ